MLFLFFTNDSSWFFCCYFFGLSDDDPTDHQKELFEPFLLLLNLLYYLLSFSYIYILYVKSHVASHIAATKKFLYQQFHIHCCFCDSRITSLPNSVASKHQTLTQYWFNVDPLSITSSQHFSNICAMSHIS